MADEYRDLAVSGEQIAPADAARRLVDGRGRDDWIPGPLEENSQLTEDFAKLRQDLVSPMGGTREVVAEAIREALTEHARAQQEQFEHTLAGHIEEVKNLVSSLGGGETDATSIPAPEALNERE